MSKIRVVLRVRPLSERESDGGYPVVVAVQRHYAYITDIKVPERPSADSRQRYRQFELDHGFWLTDKGSDGASQKQVYDEMGPPLEKSILEGYNACLLAYGQSGTGKTHTMLGNKEDPGLIPRLCQSLWEKLKQKHSYQNGTKKTTFRMEVSFMEIYREKVRDLLSPDKSLKLREHPQLGPHVQDLTRVEVNEEMGMLDLLWEGERRRAIGTTGSNRRSSRSHAIWTLYLTTKKNAAGNLSQTDLITNQVHLVDLAGSEKAEFSTSKNLLAEGADINRSLVSLGNVISALAEKAQYIPYRDSALTWLLKDSLGGNATTAIIITASPASCCHAQTLNSLRFAQRARLVENQPKVNASSNCGSLPMMSTFDIKKDISRLAGIIRSAQSNGGILRGLAPRHGWNRLISAIEGLNHQPSIAENGDGDGPPTEESKPVKFQRAASEDATTNTSNSPINGVAKSLTDVMVQADLLFEDSSSSSKPSTSCSVPTSPTKIISTEVFIPHSNSIKCLTWKQEETRQVQRPLASDSEEEYLSPPLTPKINHLKYLFPVHYPQTHNLDHASRISEKVHRTFNCEEPEFFQLLPVEIVDQCSRNYPVVRGKLPALVNDEDYSDICEYTSPYRCQELRKVPILYKGVSCFETCVGQPPAIEFYPAQNKNVSALESTDEDEVFLLEEEERARNMFRATQYKPSRLVTDSITSPDENILFFTSESTLTSSSQSVSSSSSYESLKAPGYLRKVRVLNEATNCELVEDVISEIIEDEPIFHNIATMFNVEETPDDEKTTIEIDETLSYTKTLDGFSSTKFRNHFAREFYQMDKIGKQIKHLQQMSEKYRIIKPYLEQISELDHQDHSLPDPKLDQEIENCSGWNVDIEFQKVAIELSCINKILKTGSAPLHPAAKRRESSGTNSRASTTITSSESLSASGGNRSRRESFASSNMFEPKMPSSHYIHQNNLNSVAPHNHNPLYSSPCNKQPLRYSVPPAMSNSCHTFGTLASSLSNSTLNHHSSGVQNSNSSPSLHNLRRQLSHSHGVQHSSNQNSSHWPTKSHQACNSSKSGSHYETMGDQSVPPYHYSFYPPSYPSQGPSPPHPNSRNDCQQWQAENLNTNRNNHSSTSNYDKCDHHLPPPFPSMANLTNFQNGHHNIAHNHSNPPPPHNSCPIPTHLPNQIPTKCFQHRSISREGSSMAGYTSTTSASCYERGSMDLCSCQESISSSLPSVSRCLQHTKSSLNASATSVRCGSRNGNGTDSSSNYALTNMTPPQQLKKIRINRKNNRFET